MPIIDTLWSLYFNILPRIKSYEHHLKLGKNMISKMAIKVQSL